MSEQEGEKSFAPSEKRKRDAAGRGDVLRSRELGTAAGTLVAAGWMLLAGPWALGALSDALRRGLVWDRADLVDFAPGERIIGAMAEGLPPVLVLAAGVLAAGLISQLGVGDGRWIMGNLAPKASRINPLSGLKRMFGPTGWIEIAKGLAKVALLGAIVWRWAQDHVEGMARAGRGDLASELALSWQGLVTLAFLLAGGLFVIALVDLPVQWLRRMMRLRMTLQDVRDEAKEAEGSPERRAAIKERQRTIAMGGLVPAIKDAQFVVTNPTHFSVALAYDPERDAAPVVVARGRGDKALAMRQLAAEYAVPTLEYPSLARALFFTTRERQAIREELYVAVASVLAFVLSLKRGEQPVRPEVSVPVTLRFDADGRLESAETQPPAAGSSTASASPSRA